jgi:outer membrane protein OmpA-like peptidoglycan-associated protein
MIRPLRFAALLLAAGLAACAQQPAVVVLPAADGHIGGVVMTAGSKSVVLDSAYASAAPGDTKPGQSSAEDVNRNFADVLAARPIPPKSYRLYFLNDSDEMTPDSRADFERVFAEISRRQAAEIVITGHTDTKGAQDYNDKLSLERAISLEKLFTARGLSQAMITPAGRGERDAVGPDDTSDPQNRYAEITVR